jgi:pimeloyl-ACP methyl ester carboxylesterase
MRMPAHHTGDDCGWRGCIRSTDASTVTVKGNSVATSYAELPNKQVSAANGVDYAYRETGESDVPVLLLQHFRGNLDSWDPALVDALAVNRRVIAFDNAGVGGSTGVTPDTIGQMARDAFAFLTALDAGHVDLLGFSIGSFVAQEITLIRPAIVRRVVLASSAPQGAAGMLSTTRSAPGASRTTRRCSGWPPSSTRCSWPTATATR